MVHLFEVLRNLNTIEKSSVDFVGKVEDYVLIGEIGHHQAKGKPLTMKQVFALNLSSIATVQRRVRRLKEIGLVKHQRLAGDHRVVELTLSPKCVRILTKYGALMSLKPSLPHLAEMRRTQDLAIDGGDEQIQLLARLSSENPNPVLCVRRDGVLLYANESSRPWLTEWTCEVGQSMPPFWRSLVAETLAANSQKKVDLYRDHHTYAFVIAPISEQGYVNLYARDITERKRTEQQLSAHARQLQDMTHDLLKIQEAERLNIYYEMRDSIIQNLAALNMYLARIRVGLPKNLSRATGTLLDDAHKLLEAIIVQARGAIAVLHPPMLDDFGLFTALRAHAVPFSSWLNIPVTVNGNELSPRLESAVELALFRIAQEALANVAKYAHAKRVDVTLMATTETVTLTITGDGVDFDTAINSPGEVSRGLAIMRERAEVAGLKLRVESAPGRGTQVSVEAPRHAP